MRITRWAGQDLQTPSQARTLPLRTTAAAVACARAPQACKYATVPDQLQKFRQMCPSASTCPGEAKHEDAEQQQEDEQAPAVVNAPYFGMLFVQRLLRNHHNLTILGVSGCVGARCGGRRGTARRGERRPSFPVLSPCVMCGQASEAWLGAPPNPIALLGAGLLAVCVCCLPAAATTAPSRRRATSHHPPRRTVAQSSLSACRARAARSRTPSRCTAAACRAWRATCCARRASCASSSSTSTTRPTGRSRRRSPSPVRGPLDPLAPRLPPSRVPRRRSAVALTRLAACCLLAHRATWPPLTPMHPVLTVRCVLRRPCCFPCPALSLAQAPTTGASPTCSTWWWRPTFALPFPALTSCRPQRLGHRQRAAPGGARAGQHGARHQRGGLHSQRHDGRARGGRGAAVLQGQARHAGGARGSAVRDGAARVGGQRQQTLGGQPR